MSFTNHDFSQHIYKFYALRIAGWIGGVAQILSGIAWGVLNLAPENIPLMGHIIFLTVGLLGFFPFLPMSCVLRYRIVTIACYMSYTGISFLWLCFFGK